MSLLRRTDFNKLKNQLKEYYGQPNVNRAIDSLMQFYQEEAFDDEDITNDWIPKDFKNCDGIQIFVNNLNFSAINNTQNKHILFNWFCHWLLPDVPEPSQPPIHPIVKPTPGPSPLQLPDSDPIQIVAKKFAIQLTIHIQDERMQETNNITETFIQICKENEYTDIDQLMSDVENIDDSFIIEEIINKYPQCTDIQQQIFDVLQHIVFMLKYDNYPPFDLKRFRWSSSTETWDRTNKLCAKEIPSFFHNEQQKCTNQGPDEGGDYKDGELVSAKAIDFENNFPFLMNMIDAFVRYCADENRKFWSYTGKQDPHFRQNQAQHDSTVLRPTEWFKNRGGLYNYIKKTNSETAECIVSGLESMLKRPLNKLNFNFVMDSTIFDSVNIFAKYLCAMNMYIYQMLRNSNEYANNANDSTENVNETENVPFQIDFWIIPRFTKRNVYNDHQLPDDIYEHTFYDDDDDADDDDDDKKDDDAFDLGEGQQLGKSDATGGDTGQIWNMKDNLEADGYEEGTDYWCHVPKIDNYGVQQLQHNIGILCRKNKDWRNKRYTRYILIIDRRNPKHIKETKMTDDTHKAQTWNDRMYLIRPKVKISKKKTNYAEIAKQYPFVLNETFIANTKDFLFSLPRYKKGNDQIDFGGLDSGKGYKFVVSFHVYFSNKVKMYWYYGKGALRLFMDDIHWLWPRFFNMKDKNSNLFQELDNDTTIALHAAIERFPLKDLQFDEFLDQYSTFDVYKTALNNI